MTTNDTSPTETPADIAERVYRERRAAGDSAEKALRDARAVALNAFDPYGTEGRERRLAVDARLDAIAAPDLHADRVATLLKKLGGRGVLSQEGATVALAAVEELRREGHAADADRVELALCREALRAVALRSNEAPVRDLAWAARGL